MIRRLGFAAIFSAVLCAAALPHAFTGFDGVRVKAIRDPTAPTNGLVAADVPPASRVNELEPPFAVIAEIGNGGAAAGRFTLRVDGTEVCTAEVAAKTTRRVDCAMRHGWQSSGAHQIAVLSDATDWRLVSFELATHHGGSGRWVDVRIVPSGFRHYDPVGPTGAVLLFGFYVLVFMMPPLALPRWLVAARRLLGGLLLTGLALTWVLPLVSPYALLVSARTIVNWSLVLLAPRLWTGGRAAVRRVRSLGPATMQASACALVTLLVFCGYRTLVVHRVEDGYHGNYSGLYVIARDTFDHNPLFKGRDDIRRSLILEDSGYDGQFVYFAAFDPFLRAFHDDPVRYNQVMDAPPYRFGRIGLPWLTRLLDDGRWWQYPETTSWLIVIALAGCAMVLALLARDAGAPIWYGLLAFLVPGFFMSVLLNLPEPLAAATLLAGYWAFVSGRRRWALAAFAASLLFRETGALFVVCLAGEEWLRGRRGAAIGLLVAAGTPVVLWHLYLGHVLSPVWGLRGFLLLPHDLGPPFGGFATLWSEMLSRRYDIGGAEFVRAGFWLPVVLTGACALAVWAALRRPGAVTVAAALYGLVAISLNFESIWVGVGNGQRGTYEVFVLLAMATTQARFFRAPLRVALQAFWLLPASYVFYGGFDAGFVRDSLINVRLW